MPAIAGRKSTFEVSTDGNTFVHVDGLVDISFSYNVSEIECTKHSIGLSDAGRREYLPNLEDRTFDISCRWLDGDPGQDIILDAASTNPKTIFYYRFKMDTVTNIPFIGRAFATSISPTGPLDDTAGVDFTLRCTTLGLPEPALDLQFAETLSLTDQASGNNLITFTRATSATYVGADGFIKTAASGEARFDHDPITRESLGLLIEEQRTNLHTNSNTWSIASASVASGAIAPDGSTNGTIVTSTGGGVYKTSVTVSSGQTVTAGAFVKYVSGGQTIDLFGLEYLGGVGGGNSYRLAFNTLTGEVSSVGSLVSSYSVTPHINGWFRVSVTATATATGGANFTAYTTSGNVFQIWGAQLEEGSFPTSYIPTTTASVTRNVDTVLIDGANFTSWYNQNEGSFLAEYQRPFDAKAVGYSNPRIFSVSQGTSLNDRIEIFSGNVTGRDDETVYVITGGSATADIRHPPTIGANESARMSMSYSAILSQASSSRDGNPSVGDTSAAIFTSMDRIRVGNVSNAPSAGNSIHNGTIKSLTYYDQRIPNAALQELTVK